MKFVLLFCGLLLVANSQVVLADSSEAINEVLIDLTQEVNYQYQELSRDVYLYHWNKKEYVTGEQRPPTPWDLPASMDYITGKILWTYKKNLISTNMRGPTFYAATNPKSTTEYGDTLVEIRLPTNLRYLDTRKEKRFSDSLQMKLHQSGCYKSTLSAMLATRNNDPCHMMATRLFEILYISAVAYDYHGSKVSYCPDHDETAFILVNPKLGDSKYAHVFVPGERPNDAGDESRARIQDVYMASGFQLFSTKLWRNIGPSKIDIGEWSRDHLFGCDLTKHPEDKLPDSAIKRDLPKIDWTAQTPSWDNRHPMMGDEPDPCQHLAEENSLDAPVIDALKSVTPALNAITE